MVTASRMKEVAAKIIGWVEINLGKWNFWGFDIFIKYIVT